MTAPATRAPATTRDGVLEASIGRLLTIGTYVSITLIAIGTVLLLLAGQSPLDPNPPLVVRDIPGQILALEPVGFLWLGILAMVVTPAGRVVAALVGFARRGERSMAVVAALILVVLAIGVVVGVMAG
jgi:uncharacterized membrane protein